MVKSYTLLFLFVSAGFFTIGINDVKAINPDSYISTEEGDGYFPVVSSGVAAPLCINSNDYPGVIRALQDLQSDINRVTGITPELVQDSVPNSGNIVLVGTLGMSPLIDKMVDDKKIDVSGIKAALIVA